MGRDITVTFARNHLVQFIVLVAINKCFTCKEKQTVAGNVENRFLTPICWKDTCYRTHLTDHLYAQFVGKHTNTSMILRTTALLTPTEDILRVVLLIFVKLLIILLVTARSFFYAWFLLRCGGFGWLVLSYWQWDSLNSPGLPNKKVFYF